MDNSTLATRIEGLADAPKDISLRELLTKIYIRPVLFWTCIIVPTILALIFTALVPTTWKTSVKIMIRYSSSESAFLQGLIPAERATLSGASSAELLRSIPTLVNAIRENDIQDDDIYKEPHEVLGGHLSGLLEEYFPGELPPGLPGVDPATLLLAKAFKDSLEESSGSSSKKKPVEVLEKSSQVPASMKGDELITVVVRSFNREKAAQMANGLAKSFIDEYYRVSAEEAHQSYLFLNDLVEKASSDLERLKKGDDTVSLLNTPNIGLTSSTRQPGPLVDSLSRRVIELESELARANELYSSGSEEISNLRGQLVSLRAELVRQERIDQAQDALEQLKLRRYQAENTEKVYTNRLVPISIVEPAFTPKKSFSKVAVRYLIAGAVGLVLGLMLGLGLIIVLDVTDTRIYTTWQARDRFRLPVLAALPDLGRRQARDPLAAASNASLGMINGLLQIFCRLVGTSGGDAESGPPASVGGKVIVLASPSDSEGKTFVSLALAGAMGQGGRHRVLLVDASLKDAGLTHIFGKQKTPGFVDAMLDGGIDPSRVHLNVFRGCDFLAAGDAGRVASLGFYEPELRTQLEGLRASYDFIVIDTGSLLSSNEALFCGMHSDHVVLVVSARQTRRTLMATALQKLREVGITPDGLIFNRKRDVLPGFLYRNL